MAAVELRGLGKSFDGSTAVIDGVDLDVRAGEFVAVAGPPGSGKSTLLRLLAGLERPDRGEIHVAGLRVDALKPRRRGVALVQPDGTLYPYLGLLETLGAALRRRTPPRSDADRMAALERALQRYEDLCSAGPPTRAREPGLLLFDDPLEGMAAAPRREAAAALRQLQRRLSATVIYATRDGREAMALAERLCLLQAGRRTQFGTPAAVHEQPATLFAAACSGAPPMNLVPCRVADGYAALGPLRLALPFRLAAFDGARTLGLRPEHLTLQPQSDPDLELPTTLASLEPQGAHVLATVRVGDVELKTWLPSDARPAVGVPLVLHLNPHRLHLFDPRSGRARGR